MGQAAQLRRNRPAQLVAIEIQPMELSQAGQFGRDGSAELVSPEIQPLEMGQAAQLRRNRPAELVSHEVQRAELGQPDQFWRYRPAELVSHETQHLEMGQSAQLRRYPSAQLVSREFQRAELGQPAQFRRYPPAQIVVPETQAGDPAVSVGLNPEPLRQRQVAEPVGAVVPPRTARGVIKSLQHLPVRHRRGFRIVDGFRGLQVGSVAAALARSPSIVDDSVGQEGIAAEDPADPHIALGDAGSVFLQDGVELPPSPGRDRQAGHGVGQHSRRPIVDVQLEADGAVIDFSGVDQGQVAAVFPVLPQAVNPDAGGEGRAIGHGVVEDAVVSSGAVGGGGPGPDHDPAHVAAQHPGEQGPGQPPSGRTHARDALLSQFGVKEVGNDPLLARPYPHPESGRPIGSPDPVGHKMKIKDLGLLGEVGHHQFAGEGSHLHDCRKGLPPGLQQRTGGHREDEGAVRVEIVVDDTVGVKRRGPAHPLHLHVAVGEAGLVQDAVVLMKPSRRQGEQSGQDLVPPRRLRVSGEDRHPQANRSVLRRSHVLQSHVGAILPALPQPAQIDRFLVSGIGGNARIGQACPALGHQRGDTHRHAEVGGTRDLHPQGPEAVARLGNGNAQPPQIGQSVRFDLLLPRSQPVGCLSASPAAVGRVGVVESCLPPTPVGQGQLRGEEGIVLSGRGQEDRDEEGRRGTWMDGR